MASIKQLDERRYKITVSNGYRPNGKKISKAKTIQVPPSVPKRGIGQYVAHAAEELVASEVYAAVGGHLEARVGDYLKVGRKFCCKCSQCCRVSSF